MEKKLPIYCPSCNGHLNVESLNCQYCQTKVMGDFQLPDLIHLTADDQKFILEFVKASGSIKLIAEQMKLSYPTVRNILDDIIEKIKNLEG
ncbi:DUF2089 family protein [Arachidicoccus terrestris]|uniref:DUF2089 family protein n=1 Tax=Arachidicoccus terrestris TaxID=2875539 RepID=UPI001CC76520|nr:DUF2089 family protein [Arachidicoccus terrestris]UAY55270.1 DUF2089 domain-containing protein [Arachidicoccus terrestris]